MKHSVKHGLDKSLARKAMKHAVDSYTERFSDYNPQVDWVTEDRANVSFSAKGVSLDGNVHLDENDITMEMDIPLLLRPFKKKAVSVVDEEINRWIEKARNGELDNE